MCKRSIAVALLSSVPAIAGTYRFGAIWDGAKVWKDACVTTQGDRIQSVGACTGTVVDLSRFTAIPGLIDVHTHMTYVLDNRVARPDGVRRWSFFRRTTLARRLKPGSPRCATWAPPTMPISPCATSSTTGKWW